jgi:predicted MFS family arabinose efflux permease
VDFTQDLQRWFRRDVELRAIHAVGGLGRLKVLVLLACVLGLDSANKATVGTMAVQLEHALNIGNLGIGLLVAASTAIGIFATIPMGILTDRVHRSNLLAASIVLWSASMLASGFANSFLALLLTRLVLGAAIAAATPIISSLTGDYFEPGIRGRMWGYILSGVFVGAGFGILVSGWFADFFSWRAAFWVLSGLSMILAVIIWRYLPEPVRGHQSRLPVGLKKIPTTKELRQHHEKSQRAVPKKQRDKIVEEIKEEHIPPRNSQVLNEGPTGFSFLKAARYILSIRTNVYLIIASAFGYFYFTGLQAFAVVLLHSYYHLSQSSARVWLVVLGVGAIIGVLIPGHISDKMIGQGRINARVVIASATFLIAAVLFLAGLLIPSFFIAAPFLFLGAASYGGTNPPLNAARLDIMHSRLWGRAESVRMTLRYAFESAAPIAFGWLSTILGKSGGAGRGNFYTISNSLALSHTFMIMLLPVVAAGIILFWAAKTYPRDVATVLASEEITEELQ